MLVVGGIGYGVYKLFQRSSEKEKENAQREREKEEENTQRQLQREQDKTNQKKKIHENQRKLEEIYDILKNYYGDNIDLVFDAPVQNVTESYPGSPLRIGSSGDDVRRIQNQLNRISKNYPLIPKIPNPLYCSVI